MMAVYDREQQAQIDEINAWWKQYRLLVLLVVSVAVVTVSGLQAWRYHENRQALEAGELYAQLEVAAGTSDTRKVQDIAAVITDKYARTGYAPFAALAAARAAFDGGDTATVKARLQWVIDNGREDAMREIARLRLAAVLLDAKQYDDALKLLATQHMEGLSALYADLKGDVLVAQGKAPEARAAYQTALDKSEAKSNYRALVQVKLDALGASR